MADTASESQIIQRESGGKPYIGWGDVDLSKAPLDRYGFPIWSGRMGPAGISHAAGLYQFEPATWREGAAALGVTDFSPESQKRVFDYIHGKYGNAPWAASAPGHGRPEGYDPETGAFHVTLTHPGGSEGGGGLSPTGNALLDSMLKSRYGAAEEPTGNSLLDGLLQSSLFGPTEQAPQPSPTDIAARQLQQAPPPPPPAPTVPKLQPGQPIPPPRIQPIQQPPMPSVPTTPMPGQPSVPRPPVQQAGDVVPFGGRTILPGLVGPEGRTIDLGGGMEMEAAPPLISPGQYPFMPQTEPSLRYLLRHGAANEAAVQPTGNNLLDRLLKQVSPISTAQAAERSPPPQPQPQPAAPAQKADTGNSLLDNILKGVQAAAVNPLLPTSLAAAAIKPFLGGERAKPTDDLAAYIADPLARSDVDIQTRAAVGPPSPIQSLADLGGLVSPYLAGGAPGGAVSAGIRRPGGPRAEPPPLRAGGAAPTGPAPGMTRLYRAETPVDKPYTPAWGAEDPAYKAMLESSGRWFTDDPAEAEWYLKNEHPGGRIVHVDVPTAEAERFRLSNIPEKPGGKSMADNPRAFSRRPEKEFFLPRDVASGARPLEGGAGGRPPGGRVPGAEVGGPGERPPPAGPPPGRIGEAATAIKDAVNKAKTEFQIFATPMATGPEAGVAIAKDFANGERLARWHRMQFDKTLNKFTPQQWREMWDAMDRASVTAQATGNLDAAMRHIAMLDEPQRAALLEMERFGIDLWEKARAAGVVSEDATRLPFYVMRGVIQIGEDGSVMPIRGGLGGTSNINPIGGNLRTRGAFQREHLTTEETEAAAQARFGPGVQVVRDIRMLPLAYERLEKAIAGRTLINELKGMEPVVGRPLVAEGHQPPGFMTIDHPSFKVYRVVGKKPDGSPIWVARPLFVAKEMEGPLRAVLRSEPGAIYAGAMALKAGATSLIMNSPLIHNMVEWGRALPAMPGKIATFRIYGLGRQTLRNKALMEQAIGQDGLVPIGRGYQQDITGIAEANPVIRHRGMLSNLMSIASERGAQQIDKAGRFWHETLLWDRVAELQAGLYSEMRTSLINRGSDPAVAGKIAAHFANRYAGALPQEAMGEIAKRLLNVALFSRSFTMGNLGVLKDMINGLPRDVRVPIGRDLTALERQTATSLARRKAIGIVAMDIALAYVGNTLLENAIHAMKGESLSDIEKEYADRFERLLAKGKEHPMDVLNPFNDAVTLLPQSQHEPGKENRVELWQQPDGTMIYGRLPTGKVGEEFQGWMTQPVQMLKNKEGTLARPLFNILNNDRGFGQRVYNPQATGVSGAAKNLGSVVWELLRSQIPEGQVQGTIDAIQGRGGALPWVQALAPFFGMNISKGAPGGPKVGVEMETRRRIEGETKDALPRVKRLVEDGKIEEAEGILLKLGMSPFAIKSLLRTYMDPEGRAGRGMKPFMRGATPEEIERLEHVR